MGEKQKKCSRSCTFCLYEVYLLISQKRMRIVAASARVAVPCGAMVLAVRPLIRPAAFAHFIDSSAQLLIEPASLNALRSADLLVLY